MSAFGTKQTLKDPSIPSVFPLNYPLYRYKPKLAAPT